MNFPWIEEKDLSLVADLYLFTMAESYRQHGMNATAVFELIVRDLPPNWNFLVSSGQEEFVERLSKWRFSDESLRYLKSLRLFSPSFLSFLKDLRFTGEVYAVPEGTLIFPHEPILQVRAPLREAQLVETIALNLIHFQTLVASKGARAVLAAKGKTVVDFGLRRIHGIDAGLRAARSFYLAGVDKTSNVLAGKCFGIPVSGTMAHSYIEASLTETKAFKQFAESYPNAILLVDTYDTLQGVKNVIDLARKKGRRFRVRGIRLDSGDLETLSKKARRLLNEAGLTGVSIFASGGLDEYEVARLLEAKAPIDGFGVGTKMGVAADRPYLDMAYKLVEYGGIPRMKRSSHKETLPGCKQVYRRERGGKFWRDEIALWGEKRKGTPILQCLMKNGRPLKKNRPLKSIRRHVKESLEKLPDPLKKIRGTKSAYPVKLSPGLKRLRREIKHK